MSHCELYGSEFARATDGDVTLTDIRTFGRIWRRVQENSYGGGVGDGKFMGMIYL